MNRKPTASLRLLQYSILILASFFAFYPVWFAILASGRAGSRSIWPPSKSAPAAASMNTQRR